MDYRVEVWNRAGLRVASYDEVPLLEATRRTGDQADRIRGMLPAGIRDVAPGYVLRVLVEGRPFCEAHITRVDPQWGDTRRLILGKYVSFHEVVEVDAEAPGEKGNSRVTGAYTERPVSMIVKDAINRAPGRVHYSVHHGAYPDGAEREFEKFLGRRTEENELSVGEIAAGQWVGASRIDASGATAIDGATVRGLVVDGEPWPDLRLMMIDCEDPELTGHAIGRHPEVAEWDAARYALSGYKLSGDAARSALQQLIASKGIDYIELNPFRGSAGAFSGRIDGEGRYVGLVFGGGECFNAGLVEIGHAEVYLREEGAFDPPTLALKDFFSYGGQYEDSIEEIDETLDSYDTAGGLFETLTALAYAASGCVWSVGGDLAVSFRRVAAPDRVVQFDPFEMSLSLGVEAERLFNGIRFLGNPVAGGPEKEYGRAASVANYGAQPKSIVYYGLAEEDDADRLVEGLLDDVAYPSPCGYIRFFRGEDTTRVGDVLEVRGAQLRRLHPVVEGEWGGEFQERFVGRVKSVTQRLSGQEVSTIVGLTSPLRSVENPAVFVDQTLDIAGPLFQFRLDDGDVGLNGRFYLA